MRVEGRRERKESVEGREGNIERELECAVCVGDRVERKEGKGVLEEGRKKKGDGCRKEGEG